MKRTEEEQRAWEQKIGDAIDELRIEQSRRHGGFFAGQWSRWQGGHDVCVSDDE